jgi:uncharacterized protein (DUF1330 family)
MAAYIIGRVQVTDWPRYSEYMKLTPGIIAQYGGRFIARGGESMTLEGPEETHRVVILEFPTFTAAQQVLPFGGVSAGQSPARRRGLGAVLCD